jgi:hypothetical protein
MRENRIINRRIMNIRRKEWRKESKEFLTIEYEIGKPYESYEPSAPIYEEIDNQSISPPVYEQKPDECGTTIKNFINNTDYINPIFKESTISNITKSINNIKINNINSFKSKSFDKLVLNTYLKDELCTEGILHVNNIKLLGIEHIRNTQGNINDLFKPFIPITINSVTNTEEIIPNVEDYKKQLLNIDYSIYQPYQGVQLRKLFATIIEFQFKLYSSNNNINSKTIKFINNIIKHIPK